MDYSKNTWQQLKGKNADDLIRALVKDGFLLDVPVRTERIYRHPDGRKISIHYHKGSNCFGRGLLKAMFDDIGWTERDMQRVKLIK
jgi:predicted RNA binding protein YcfA (HicA-like mRNA interferase family)